MTKTKNAPGKKEKVLEDYQKIGSFQANFLLKYFVKYTKFL